MADSRTYQVTEQQVDALEAFLGGQGLFIDLSVAGEKEDEGWDISWSMPNATTLTITVNKHPFLEEGAFWAKVKDILAQPAPTA
jgi:hypothetical protein